MSIISYQQTRLGDVTQITVTSDLVGEVTYYWYRDGSYLGSSRAPTKIVQLAAGDQARLEVLDSLDPGFDPIANAPAGWPARRSLFWVASADLDVDHYRVEQQKGAGAWELIERVFPHASQWSFSLLTGRLEDLADYSWRIIPVDLVGNQGTPIVLGPERMVRTPDAPDFALSFDPVTTRVTFNS